MTKQVDISGFWLIENNPLSKAGVFPYLGKQIDDKLEPNKIYNVYRPIEEITKAETVASFNAVPLIDEHEMIGEGFTEYDKRPAGGVVFNTKADGDRLVGDIKIFSEKLKKEIESGKKELSMGYLCKYEPCRGVFDGKVYDFIQKDLKGNHVALVNKGRMGSDVRVYDQKITFDCLEIKEMAEVKDENVDKRKGISEIEAMLYEAKKDPAKLTDELIRTIAGKVEKNSYNKSEANTADDEKKEAKDDCKGKDDGEEVKKQEDAEVKAEEPKENEVTPVKEKAEEKEPEKKEEKSEEKSEDKKAGDSMQEVFKMIAERDALVNKVKPLIGAFDCAEMTVDDVAKYSVEKLGIACDSGEEVAVLKGYLQAKQPEKMAYSMDADVTGNADKTEQLIADYLK